MKFGFVVVGLLAWSGWAHAGLNLGGGIGFGSLEINDPDGETSSSTANSFSGILTYAFDESPWRLWTDVTYQSASFDGSTSHIGQNVSAMSLNGIVQRSFPLGDVFYGWVGGGAGLEQVTAEDRSRVDANDFVIEAYPDRDDSSLVAIGNFGVATAIGRINKNAGEVMGRWNLGLNASYRHSVGDGTSGLMVSLFALY